MYRYDNRVVITLDAGGTNLVFGAMQANKFIVEPITMPSNSAFRSSSTTTATSLPTAKRWAAHCPK